MDIHYSYRLGISTIAEIIGEVCFFLWYTFKNRCLSLPSKEKWLQIAQEFEMRANFPNCIGAVDGKHIRIIKPSHSGSIYYNYKHYFSIVLLAVCDADYKFTYVNIGAYGKDSDSSIFKDSEFFKKLSNNSLEVPENKPISRNNPTPAPYFIVGDEAFGQTDKIMRPYAGTHLNERKINFNTRLSRARRFIECTFGILSNKWRIFHRPMNVNVQLAVGITKACCVLHNYIRERDGYKFEDTLSVTGFVNNSNCETPRATGRGSYYRDLFAEFFMSEGRLEW